MRGNEDDTGLTAPVGLMPDAVRGETSAGASGAEEPFDVARWRKAERERLIGERLAMPSALRREHAESITWRLSAAIGNVRGLTVSAYWPFRGEPDLRGFLEGVIAGGGRAALPVVVARGSPLVFRAWAPGEPLERGVWNIPVPAADAETVTPDVVIAPVVGFDAACYRLGYGGGFFDRTIAALARRPRVFGVGYGEALMATIHPQMHDVAMDVVVTESRVWERPATETGERSAR